MAERRARAKAKGPESRAAVFGDLAWRMNHLYRIVDEQGREVPFAMRDAQRELLSNMWYRNIVLKARQLGFTTFIDLLGLDRCLFVPNTVMAVIAESKDKASEIFDKKIRFPYDRLPPEIKSAVGLSSCSKQGLELSNGSRISVTVSARSMTCNFLHVSEYGPVSAREPQKAREILTGSFPTVHEGGHIFVESTAMGAAGDFYELVKAAQARASVPGELAEREFRLHFFPWWRDPKCRMEGGAPVVERLERYFDALEAERGIRLDAAQRSWYAATEAQLRESMWSEFPSFAEEAFQTARDGSYYGRQFEAVLKERRLSTVPYEEALPVYTAWDLGVSDDMAVWFAQFVGSECRVIDYYAASGEGLPHYVGVLRDKGYRYARHFAPHDIAVRELSTGTSRQEAARRLGLEFERVMTNQDVPGGIEAVRDLLPRCWFDAARCEEGVKCLQAYRREWDDRRGCYRDRPCHDWASHGADAFRTLAVAWKCGLVDGAGLTGAAPSYAPEELNITGGLREVLW